MSSPELTGSHSGTEIFSRCEDDGPRAGPSAVRFCRPLKQTLTLNRLPTNSNAPRYVQEQRLKG